MQVLRTLLASLLILVAGVATLAAASDGFRAFTVATARRLDVRAHPRPVPDVRLQTAAGANLDWSALRGRWLLVDFIYTRCQTWCSIQGSEFSRLQERLAAPINAGEVTLLSVSFDPNHDGPSQLAAWQRRSGDRGAGWIAARPRTGADLAALLRTFGVTVIDDGIGGYVHNAAIAVVDPRGRLVAIVDWNAAATAAGIVTGASRP